MRLDPVPDTLPSPQDYLRTGLPRPNRRDDRFRSWSDDEVLRVGAPPLPAAPDEATSGGRSITYTDERRVPRAVTFLPSATYLTKPVQRYWDPKAVQSVRRNDQGALRIVVGGPSVYPGFAEGGWEPIDPTGCTIVTIDTSVHIRGIDPALFAPDELLYVSAAIATDLVVSEHRDQDSGYRSTRFSPWRYSEPVPVDDLVLRVVEFLHQGEKRVLPREGLHRTDILVAATAIVYRTPLYTTRPELYRGIGNGLRVLTYGKVRNKSVPPPPG